MSQLFSIEDLTRKDVHSTPKFALFELGFRPFFLLGGGIRPARGHPVGFGFAWHRAGSNRINLVART